MVRQGEMTVAAISRQLKFLSFAFCAFSTAAVAFDRLPVPFDLAAGSQKPAISLARSYVKQHSGALERDYPLVRVTQYGSAISVSFYSSTTDPNDPLLPTHDAAGPIVFIDCGSKRVIGYEPNIYARNEVELDSRGVGRMLGFASRLDAVYNGYSPSDFSRLFRLHSRDIGEMIVVDILNRPAQSDQLRIGGGYKFFVLKKTGEVLGLAPMM